MFSRNARCRVNSIKKRIGSKVLSVLSRMYKDDGEKYAKGQILAIIKEGVADPDYSDSVTSVFKYCRLWIDFTRIARRAHEEADATTTRCYAGRSRSRPT